MPKCTCGAVVADGEQAERHLISGPHEDHRFLEPGEVWPPEPVQP